MTPLDWIILSLYLLLIIGMSAFIGRRQKSQEDYYLGGRSMPPWQIALSVAATQVSAISLIGAPAFIALKANGGLVWLQYEFAIPLAMMLIMLTLIPIYHRIRGITIYEYLDQRFGAPTRTVMSLVFLLSRGLGSGVALLATGIVTAVCLNWPLWPTILLIGVVSVVYTTFGGIKADIYSDILQLAILWLGSFVAIGVLIGLLGDDIFTFASADQVRLQVFDFHSSGWGDGKTFAFWPMLIGGFFLYLSYYGCDQSQAQRLLTTSTPEEAQKSLFINGLVRFPLVLTYSAVGVLLISFLHLNPEFAARLEGQQPDALVPYFLTEYMPKGLLGLLIAGLFAASMSSLDSAMNSLSAATYRDFLIKISPRLENLTEKQQVSLSRILTILWGAIATGFALYLIGGQETVIELVNKIGSAFYGPVLAVFWLGMFSRRTTQGGVIAGLAAGVGLNIYLWQVHSATVSWLWWNVTGFLFAFVVGIIGSLISAKSQIETSDRYILSVKDMGFFLREKKIYYIILLAAFVAMLLVSLGIERFLS